MNKQLLNLSAFTMLLFALACKKESATKPIIDDKKVAVLKDQWNQLPGKATDIAVGKENEIFITSTESVSDTGGFAVKKWNGSTWETLPGSGVRIAVDPKGRPWVVNKSNSILRYDGKKWRKLPGKAIDIGISANSCVYVIAEKQVSVSGNFIMKWNGTVWDTLPGAAVRVSADQKGRPWVINTWKLAFRFDGPPYWTELFGEANDIGVGAEGSAFVVSNTKTFGTDDYFVKKWNGGSWENFYGSGVNIAVSNTGIPWVVKANGDIWGYTTK